MVGADTDIEQEYRALLHELKEYRPDLLDKPRILAITKMDLVEGYELEEPVDVEDEAEIVYISAATGHNVEELKELIWKKLKEIEPEETS